jgi:hypothetical protein
VYLVKQLFVAGISLLCLGILQEAYGQQEPLPLKDLTQFRSPGPSWHIAGDVTADLNKKNQLASAKGEGVLVNMPKKRAAGKDLFTNLEHGDVDIELDYMMARGSNSGIYLQGRYEVQLEDSWGLVTPTAANNGGIYERWNEAKPQGQQGYQGYAPRQNVSRAPGVWQRIKISFQAPRFSETGQKTENAKILRIELNGVAIHEDVELLGPTRGAISTQEAPTGPLRLQGDHGAVAFRNILITQYAKPRLELSQLKYEVYAGKHENEPSYDTLSILARGTSAMLTSNLSIKPKQFLLHYTGVLLVKEAGDYTFDLNAPGGSALLKINKQPVVAMASSGGKGTIALSPGEYPVEVAYSKYANWANPALTLRVSGPGLRQYLISESEANLANATDPILVDPRDKPVLRSFMDMPGPKRVTHAISVGNPSNVHYTYDLEKGALLQVWRGGFLDATPMWHDRGDGSSRPLGAVQHLATPSMGIARLQNTEAAWLNDTTGSAFRSRGYIVNANDEPTFNYQAWGSSVQDAIRVLADGQGVQREIRLQNPAGNLYVRLGEGSTIEEAGRGLYLMDGKAFYIRLDDAGGAKPVIRRVAERQELIIPVREKLIYSILF